VSADADVGVGVEALWRVLALALALKLIGAFGVGIEIGIGVGPSRSGAKLDSNSDSFLLFFKPDISHGSALRSGAPVGSVYPHGSERGTRA